MAGIMARLFRIFRRRRTGVHEPPSARRPMRGAKTHPRRLRSALFVDFDNILHGLHSRRPDVADALARNFAAWLGDLSNRKLPPGVEERDIRVWRAYINPKGGLKNTDGTGEWMSISRYRQALSLSGFEVVECPALTAGMKNAADIRMVVDMLASYYSEPGGPPYDEYIIASDDADFTPLLQHLRAHGCRTMIVSAGNAAHAYANIADEIFDLIDYLTTGTKVIDKPVAQPEDRVLYSRTAPSHAQPSRRTQPSRLAPTPPVTPAPAMDEAMVLEAVRRHVEASRIALPLTTLAARIGQEFGTPQSWFGHDSLGAFLQTTELVLAFQIEGGYIWDPARHTEPRPLAAPAAPVPQAMATLLRDTILPPIGAPLYWAVFAALETYVRDRGQRPATQYDEDGCVSWCHSGLLKQGMNARESDVRQILARTRVHLEWMRWAKLPPAAEDVCNKVLNNTRRTIDGRPLRPDEMNDLRDWLWAGRPTVPRPQVPRSEPLPSKQGAGNPIRAVRPESDADKAAIKGTGREIVSRTSTFKAFRIQDRSDFGLKLARTMLRRLGHGSWGKATVHSPTESQLLSYTFWVKSDTLSKPEYRVGATIYAELEALDLSGLGQGLEWVAVRCEVLDDEG